MEYPFFSNVKKSQLLTHKSRFINVTSQLLIFLLTIHEYIFIFIVQEKYK